MYILFRFFLLFCSKDFINYYLGLRQKKVVNPRVLSSTATLSFLYMGGFLFACGAIYYNLWDTRTQHNWELRGGLIFICFIIFLFCYSWIKSLEEAVYAYSDGELTTGTLVQKEWSKSGFDLKYEFEAVGEKLTLTKGRQSYFAAKKVNLGHKIPIIYARSSPRHAKFYNPGKFSQYCLDTTKERPEYQKPERVYIL
ncbi:hypothetical protein [Kiloniella sp.]|uniref:hypothetical protein n=1 Tax=Kiloniella sp. TaxID=1938587 RepID=UPI003B0196F6